MNTVDDKFKEIIEVNGASLENLEQVSILNMEVIEDAILKGYAIKVSLNKIEASNGRKTVFIEYNPEKSYFSGVRKNGNGNPEEPLNDAYPKVVKNFMDLTGKYMTTN
jgi:hypothetical protein